MKSVAVETMRALDARTIAAGTSAMALMERAGRAAFAAMAEVLCSRLSAAHRRAYTVLAGKGNNGGDAYVVARCLAEAGEAVAVYAVGGLRDLAGPALGHALRLPARVPLHVVASLPPESLAAGTVVVDGLLGTGFSGRPRPPYDMLIAQVNAADCPVVALDLPSGLDGDSGTCAGPAIEADLTVTMGAPKQGLLTPAGLRQCGCLRCVEIGIPAAFLAEAPASGPEAILLQDVRAALRRRPRDSHKGLFGHLLVVGGSAWYSGAPFLAAAGAARSGAGLVTVAIPSGCQPQGALPAALIVRRLADDGQGFIGRSSGDEIVALAEGRQALVFGPGLGPAAAGGAALARALDCGLPLLLDADGLRLLAAQPGLARAARAPLVLTPHPGEMRALLAGFACAPAAPEDRGEQARALARAAGAVVVLKGMGTVVADPSGRTAVNTSGSPALASAGTGDVLAGVIGALLGQGLAPWEAACQGVFVHGLAAELGDGAERSLTADDLAARLALAWAAVSPRA